MAGRELGSGAEPITTNEGDTSVGFFKYSFYARSQLCGSKAQKAPETEFSNFERAQESIPPAYVARWAGTTTLFLVGS